MALDRSYRFCMLVLGAACAVAATPRSLLGQTWDGGAINNNWTEPANWNPDAVPANNGTANIIFGGFGRLLPSVNAAQDILSLTFTNPAGAFTIGGANTLTIRGGGVTNNDADTQTISAPIVVQAAQTWNAASGLMSITGSTVTNNAGALTIDGSAGIGISSAIQGTGSLVKNGPSSLQLTGTNTYSGGTVINTGTVALTNGAALNDTGTVTVNGGVLSANNSTETIGLLQGSASGVVHLPLTSSLTVGNGGGTGTFSGVISGADTATFIKTGSGTLTLAGANTFPGTYRINGGQIALGVSERLDNSADLIVNGSILALLGTITETVDVVTLMNNASIGGNEAATLFGSAYNFESGGIGSHLGGSAALTKTTAGNVQLANTHTYTGGTVINAGSLFLVVNNALLSTGAVTVNPGGTLVLNSGVSNTVGALSGTGNVTLSDVNTALTVGGGNATSTFSGVISGSGSLSKTGSGTLTLSSANTYTGGTFINGGVLEISSDANLGEAGDTLNLNGMLRTTTSLTIPRAIHVTSLGGGAIETLGTTTLTGTLTGVGGLAKLGVGTLIIESGSATVGGSLFLGNGELQLPPGVVLTVVSSALIDPAGILTLDDALFVAPSHLNSGEINLLNGARLVGLVSNDGLFRGDGRITGHLLNNSAGEVRVGLGESLHVTGAEANSNAGLMEVIGGEVEFDSRLANEAETGLIYARDATLRFDGALVNAGSMAFSFGICDVFGDISNERGATITVSGNSDVTFVDDIVNEGDIRTSNGSNSVFFGAVSGGGSFPGSGTVFFEGDLRPGASPAQISFGGVVVFGSFSTLEMEIGGTTPGTGHDKLVIAQDAFLDGALDITLIDGFVPQPGDAYELLTAAAVTGTFGTVNFPADPPLPWAVNYGPAFVRVIVAIRPDFDRDYDVDQTDYSFFQACVSGPASPNSNPNCMDRDFDDDGDVDLSDFSIFQRCMSGANNPPDTRCVN